MADKKIILITGASSGIGLATALRLIADGHTVYGGARRREQMAPIIQAGGRSLSLDVTDETSMTAAVDKILDEQGRIDVLVNNAGYASYGAVEDVPLDEARRQFEVNLFGLARLTQLVLPGMRERRSGTIVNISSVGGVIHTPLGAWYHATKHAIEGFSDSLRLETEPFGVHVAIVAPGLIDTGFGAVLRNNILEASGTGAYAGTVEGLERSSQRMRGSSPDVIAAVIAGAVAARRPRTRYRAGRFSRLLVFLKRMLPNRTFDRVVTAMAQ